MVSDTGALADGAITAADIGAQPALVSGTTVKTINGNSVLGSGNIQIDGGVTSFNTRTGAVTLGSSDVTDALGFTPVAQSAIDVSISALVDAAPGTLDTLNELAAALGDDPSFATTVTNSIAAKQATLVSGTNIKTVNGSSILGSGNIQIDGGVTSFNTRTGAVTLASSDVTAALGYTPLSNATSYLPLTGGTLTGALTTRGLTVSNASATVQPEIRSTVAAANGYDKVTLGLVANYGLANQRKFEFGLIYFAGLGGSTAFLGMPQANGTGQYLWVDDNGKLRSDTNVTSVGGTGGTVFLDSGNYNSYALPLTGGTLTGTLTGTTVNAIIESSNARIKFKAADADGGTFALLGLDWGGAAGTYKDFEVYDYVNSRPMIRVFGSTRNVEIFGGLNGTTGTFSGLIKADGGTIQVGSSAGVYRQIRYDGTISADGSTFNAILHAGNIGSYAMPSSGGTLTGNLIFGNATSPFSNYIQFGDNTGWNFRFMTSVSGTPTTRFTFGDNGNFTAVGSVTGTNITAAGNVTGNAATATTATYANNTTQGFNSNWNTDFSQAPAGSTILRGDTSSGSSNGGPGGTWWFQQNMRHTNATNVWGVQVAWGWEDNANILRTRNVTSGNYGGWVTYLNSNNYTSYAPGLSTSNNFTSTNYFVSNQNTGGSSPPLQAYSNNNGGAIMSFHRGGQYAINMGLDSDNVFRIGGWSASANRLQMDMSGNLTMAGNVTAYSDERLKKDWVPVAEDFVERLAKIKHGTYTRTDSEDRQAGVSAQDWQTLLAETVMTDAEGMLSVAYGNAALVSAVELAKDNVELRARIARLETLIEQLLNKE